MDFPIVPLFFHGNLIYSGESSNQTSAFINFSSVALIVYVRLEEYLRKQCW